VTEKELHAMNILTCGELAQAEQGPLMKKLGKTGRYLRNLANGIDEREVEPDVPSKQLSTEETFPKDIRDKEWLKSRLQGYAREVMGELKKEGRRGRTVVLKVKYFDFELITRSKTLGHFPRDVDEVYEVASRLLDEKTKVGDKPVRLLGLGISGLEEESQKKSPAEKDLFDGIDFG
jgi:DNA polymerase IV